MLGELVNVVKFLLEIFKGNIPIMQLYVIAGILLLAVVCEIIYEMKNGKHRLWYLIIERTFLNIVGLLFYISFYMFGLKTLLNIWPSLILNNSIEAVSWLAINSYMSFVLLIPLGVYTVKSRNFKFKVFGVSSHLILTGVIITLVNRYFAFNIDFPVLLGILNTLVNSGLTFFLIKFGYNNEERQNNTRKLYKATSS